jgi:TatD DNase family protein
LEKEIRAAPPGLVAAVGEFGLDHHYGDEEANRDREGERELMEMQIDLAERLALPVVIHSRDAPAETIEILKKHPGTRGVIHCFSYGAAEAEMFVGMGFHISFAGNLTYKNAPKLREACAAVPAERLLLETDSPWLAPVPFRGSACHPGMVAETYRTAAAVRGAQLEELIEQIEANARELFGK